ncbi:hypothetical protein, partial [Kingella kingae]|uniref:hypothetical protein n=1 Tax=Kingella kingae TaxID=504 RepID=UPI001E2ECCB1
YATISLPIYLNCSAVSKSTTFFTSAIALSKSIANLIGNMNAPAAATALCHCPFKFCHCS